MYMYIYIYNLILNLRRKPWAYCDLQTLQGLTRGGAQGLGPGPGPGPGPGGGGAGEGGRMAMRVFALVYIYIYILARKVPSLCCPALCLCYLAHSGFSG